MNNFKFPFKMKTQDLNIWATSRREQFDKKSNDERSPYEVDYSRVIHSSSFRRLQGKTQILKPARIFLDSLQKHIVGRVIKDPNVQHLEFKGQQMVVAVFEAMASEPQSFLPLNERQKYKEEKEDTLKKRVICDYIAGMTDSFLLKSYERMFSPRLGSVFDKL